MQQFLVTDIVTQQTQILNLDEASNLAQMSTNDLEVVLAEYGICETARHTVVEIIVALNPHQRTLA